MSFTPGIAAARNLPITVDIPGITEREGVTLTVHPDFPIRVALSKDEPIVEAKNHHPVVIQATLLDRFGNTADYQTDGMSVRFAVPEKYGIYGYFSSGSTHVKEVVGHVSNGSARAVLRMSDLP
jgi:hypothetical protein